MVLRSVQQRIIDRANAAHKLSLQTYVERTRKFKLDPWQIDMCNRLEARFWLSRYSLFEDQFTKVRIGNAEPYRISPSGLRISQAVIDEGKNIGKRTAIHAPPQFGKSIIIAQCYPAWILGWDPMHRFRLATYNTLHSARQSVVVKHLMATDVHREMFSDPRGELPPRTKAYEWSTTMRMENPDGQASFTALGLQSGFTGTGFETLLMDDPYKSAEEALSDIARDKTWRFYSDTAAVRAQEWSNVWLMFHRYHQDDMGGRAIATGDFDLLRYAAIADGPYKDEDTKKVYFDPINRKEGDVLSPRFGPTYYKRQQKDAKNWFSQFQGRPSAESGSLFDTRLLRVIAPQFIPTLLHRVRGWDNAATEGGGAYSAGGLMGIDAAENIYIGGMVRKQVGTAERVDLQIKTAEEDGYLVQIHIPIDPGSAGVDVAYQFGQELRKRGYLVSADHVTGSKTQRSQGFSRAVNSGKVFLVLNHDGSIPDWHEPLKIELRYFPASRFKDQADCLSDCHTQLMRLFYRGLVIKEFGQINLVHRSLFANRFGAQVPRDWETAAGIYIAPDSSKPSGYVIVSRAAENAGLGEMVFVLAAARFHAKSSQYVLEALQRDLTRVCTAGTDQPDIIWLNKDASDILQLSAQKLDMYLTKFLDEPTAGVPETNYYFHKIEAANPFYNVAGSARCMLIVDDDQYDAHRIRNERGMLSMRQEAETWSYTDEGKLQTGNGITINCLRMCLYKFALSATELTSQEKRLAKLPPELQPAAVRSVIGTPQFLERLFAQENALRIARVQEEEDNRQQLRDARDNGLALGPRAIIRRFNGGRR